MRMKEHSRSRRGWSISAAALVVAFGAGLHVHANTRETQDDDRQGNESVKKVDKLRAFGLTSDGGLVRFRTDSPDRAVTVGRLSGFAGSDSALVGIDFRVQDGLLYGVGNAGGVYT